MAERIVCVSWNDHANELATEWKTLLANNSFVDCTITAEGKSLKAHRVILSACSVYLCMLFHEHQEKYPIVILKDTSFDILKAVVDFVYYGKTKISEVHIGPFLELAESLQINRLNYSVQNDGSDLGGDEENYGPSVSNIVRDTCEVEGGWPSHEDNPQSIRMCPHLSHDFSDSNRADTSIPLEGFSNRCKEMQSGAVVIPLQGYETLSALNDPDTSVNTEIIVKQESLHSEIDVLVPKKEVLEDNTQDEPISGNFGNKINEVLDSKVDMFCCQSEPVHKNPEVFVNPETHDSCKTVPSGEVVLPLQEHQGSPVCKDSEVFINTEISVKHEPIYSQMDVSETRVEVLVGVPQDEPVSGNSESDTNSRHEPEYQENLDPYSCDMDPFHMKRNSALEIPLQQSPYYYQPQQQDQPHPQMQQEYQQEQQVQDVTHLSCQLSEPPVPMSQKSDSTQWEEFTDALDEPENDGDEMNEETEPTLHQSLNPCSSGEYVLPDEGEATQWQRGRQLQQPKSNFPAPLEQQEPTPGEALTLSKGRACQKGRHTGKRPYICDVCGNSFTKPKYLNHHRRVHSGERPYVCKMCGKRLTDSSAFSKHKRAHTGERPYVCKLCGKGFTQSSHRDEHKRVHTGERNLIHYNRIPLKNNLLLRIIPQAQKQGKRANASDSRMSIM